MKAASVKPVRCAIYTRVSTEHGLDQEFNSLDAQYEAASAYIKSQAHAGWTLIRSRYDDGGYSGGSQEAASVGGLFHSYQIVTTYSVSTANEAPTIGISLVNMTISLAFLAPDLVRAAVEGRLPRGIGVERLRD